jgi:acetyl esterase/lipase
MQEDTMTDGRLERAIEFVQSGKMENARELLESILKEDRNNISVWHWYAQTWTHTKDKVRVWEICLRFNPDSQQAREALQDLGFTQPRKAEQQSKIPARTLQTGTRSTPWLFWASVGLLSAVAILAWTFLKASTPKDPQQYRHVQPVEYYLYVPDDYSAEVEWPLFVGIHGAGGSGLDCWNMWQSFAEKEGFILLCPSIPGDPSGFYQDVGENTVWGAVNEMKKEYNVRPRMFFAGFSAGAFFIQGFTYHYPRAVSGLAILSSGLYLDPRLFPEVIPMTVAIGGADDPTAVQTSKLFADNLNQYGFSVHYELLNGVGHAFTPAAQKLTIETFRKTVNK